FFNLPGRADEGGAIGGFRILEDLAFVISDLDSVIVAAEDIFRVDGHLAAATRSIDDILRHGVTGGVAAQLFHDLETFPDAGAQVSRTRNKIALVDVVRFHPAHEEL